VKNKISNFCHVEPSQVINIQDLASLYHVPLEMVRQDIVQILTNRLQLSIPVRIKPRKFMIRWRQLADRMENLRKEVRIALVGKYTQLEDAYASVIKALGHAALAANRKLVLTHVAAADLEEEIKNKVRFSVYLHDV
jgi:CTP synthase